MNLSLTKQCLPLLLVLLFWGCVPDKASHSRELLKPESKNGKQTVEMNELLNFVNNEEYNFHGVIIFRDSVIFEHYVPPFTSTDIHDINSCTKSLTATATGLAIRDGYFKNDSVNLNGVLNNYNQDLLLCHLLTMTSGYVFSEFHREQPESDILNKLLAQPRPLKPGKDFNYDEGNYHILSNAFQLKTGSTMSDYTRTHVFAPLGIDSFYWEEDPDGVTRGDGMLKMKPRDMLKIGQLFLYNGVWQGKEIIPEKWIKKSFTSKISPHHDEIRNAYGYGWWLPEFGGFAAIGSGGQMIYVNQDSNLVVVTTAGMKNSTAMNTLSYLLKRFALNLPDTFTVNVRSDSIPETGGYLPGGTHAFSEKKYVFDKNTAHVNSLTFRFNSDSMMAYLKIAPLIYLEIKTDGKFYFIHNAESRLAFSAAWKDENHLQLIMQDMNYFDRELYNFHFQEKGIELIKTSYSKEDTVIIKGNLAN